MQPGMAGGGLTSIPLNMHHDFAAGGIIAFADGGYPAGYEVPEQITEEQARESAKKPNNCMVLVATLTPKQNAVTQKSKQSRKEAEKGAGSNKLIASCGHGRRWP
jgi:hypothetical protein